MKYLFVFDYLALLLCPGACGLHVWGFCCRCCSTFRWSCVWFDRGRPRTRSSSLATRGLRYWKLMILASSPAFSSIAENLSSLVSINWWRGNHWSYVVIYCFLDVFLRLVDFARHIWMNLYLVYRCQYMPWYLSAFLIFRYFTKYLINLESFRLHQSNFSLLVSLFHVLKHQYFILFSQLMPSILKLLNWLQTILSIFLSIFKVLNFFGKFILYFLNNLSFLFLYHLNYMLVNTLDFVYVVLWLTL